MKDFLFYSLYGGVCGVLGYIIAHFRGLYVMGTSIQALVDLGVLPKNYKRIVDEKIKEMGL